MAFNYTKYFFLIIFLATQLAAQSVNDSLIYSRNYYSTNTINTSYGKQLNTHNLTTGLAFGIPYRNSFLGVSHNFNSTIVKSLANNIRDEQYFSSIGEYKFNELFSTGINLKYNVYSDDRSLAINKSSTTQTTIYGNVVPVEKIYIKPFLGYSDNTQIGIPDRGALYGTSFKIDDFQISDFLISSDISFKNEDINPRKNLNRLFNLALKNDIENTIKNNISGFYSEQRKDFYIEMDSLSKSYFSVNKNIQSRNEKNYYLSDHISFEPEHSNIAFNIEGRAGWRNIDRHTRYILFEKINSSSFDSKIEEFRLDFNSSLNYKSDNFSGLLRLLYSEREEKHSAKYIAGVSESIFTKRQDTEAQKNNKAQQTTITLASNYILSKNDLLSFSLFHRKLVYDTPSENNYDDRDELLTMMSMIYTRTLSPFFEIFVNLEGSLNKIVYIFSERSSNNNIQRTLKLSSGSIFKGSSFSSRNDFEVSANYTVYDFEDLNPNFKSFAFRQFSFKDSSRISLSRKTDFAVFGYLKLSEQGDFVWKTFKGKPVRYLTEIFIEPKLQYFYKKISFSAGLRYFSLDTYKFDNKSNKIMDTEYNSIGPLAAVMYSITGYLSFKCSGWYEFISNEQKKNREMANLFIDVRWDF